jgi:hypothetical protein
MAAIIHRAMDDLRDATWMDRKAGRIQKDQAMAFFHSPDFEAFCLELGIDPEPYRAKAAELYRHELEKENFKARSQTREKISKSMKGRKITWAEKISASMKGRKKSEKGYYNLSLKKYN